MRSTCKMLSPVIAQPDASSSSAIELAPLRDRFFSGRLTPVSCTNLRFFPARSCLCTRRGRLVAGPSIVQQQNKQRAVVSPARNHVVGKGEVPAKVIEQQPPGGIWQPLDQHNRFRSLRSLHLSRASLLFISHSIGSLKNQLRRTRSSSGGKEGEKRSLSYTTFCSSTRYTHTHIYMYI